MTTELQNKTPDSALLDLADVASDTVAVVPGEPVNVATVPQLSPFRYPGGKTWLIPWIRRWLTHLQPRPRKLVEPFAGGGSVSLAAVFEDLVEWAILVERDEDVGAVWETMLSRDARRLADSVLRFQCSKAAVHDVLTSVPNDKEGRAFRTLVMNRTRYGGIIAPGAAPVKRGENGRGLSSRWYPQTLSNRILAIDRKRDRLIFIGGDGMEYLELARRHRDVAFFVDPPYVVAGKRLYSHSEINHHLLFEFVSRLSGDFLMTYDDNPAVRRLARRHGLELRLVPMTSTKHERKYELLVGRDLSWLAEGSTRQLTENPVLEDVKTDRTAGGQAFNCTL